MVFSDQAFVFFFLPIALACCLPLRRTPLFSSAIFVFSLAFFYWESGELTIIFLASALLNYIGGIVLENNKNKLVLFMFIGANLALLSYFKYVAFVLGVFDFFGDPSIKQFASDIVLPIGISFYTFQGISYLIDVWRGDVKAEQDPITFGAYKSFFPQLIAGPIVRYVDVAADFHRPAMSFDMFSAGAARFMLGLCKKLLIADSVAPIANAAFFSGQDLSFASSWLGAVAFAIQIYFDFSGYSDMAIGLASMFGIRIKENFDHPYASSTITEFWRRWHISLSSWFRDYLYIPLGGNRAGNVRTYVNLCVVFLATGIWHGAAWTFLFWGLFHGTFLIVERLIGIGGHRNPVLRLCYFFPTTMLGWALFQAPDLQRFGELAYNMASPMAFEAFSINDAMVASLGPQSVVILLIGTAALLLQGQVSPIGPALDKCISSPAKLGRLGFIVASAAISFVYILPQSFSPFLYFRF